MKAFREVPTLMEPVMALNPLYLYRRGIITCSGPTSSHYASIMAVLAAFGPRGGRWEAKFHTTRSGTTTLQIGFVDLGDQEAFTAYQYLYDLPR